MKKIMAIWLACWAVTACWAQRGDLRKMSPLVRNISREMRLTTSGSTSGNGTDRTRKRIGRPGKDCELCAFVKVDGDMEALLNRTKCKLLAQEGDITIVSIPLHQIDNLSRDRHVLRIEANQGTTLTLDTLSQCINAVEAYEGHLLPHAFRGKGVMVGVQDIGFDLTHPTFLSSDGKESRIRAFWDHLSTDTLDSELYVGADYTTPEALRNYTHSRDSEQQFHGTHTLGIAAGNGFGTAYRGLASEADICLVSNAVGSDSDFISEADQYKYTYATDALGFKYIFDLAEAEGKPCVISFSEGSSQDYRGDDMLYYEMLSRLTGPGRILVASAGNVGHSKSYFHKSAEQESIGAYARRWGNDQLMLCVKADGDFSLRLTIGNEVRVIPLEEITQQPDSLWSTTISCAADNNDYTVEIEAYPSCYNPEETACDITVTGPKFIGYTPHVAFEIMGKGTEADCYFYIGETFEVSSDKRFTLGDGSHSVYSPGCAPSVICVGATAWRNQTISHQGKTLQEKWGNEGQRAAFSSMGPTWDGRVKPDVMAPGCMVISAMNSYFMEANPESDELSRNVSLFYHEGRTYGWIPQTGTSMSTPAVAGAIALWLEACPTLSPEQVREVLANTCRHPSPDLSYPNNEWGYGEIDVVGGLLYLLGADGISKLTKSQQDGISATIKDNILYLTSSNPAATSQRVSLYDSAGHCRFSSVLPAGQQQAQYNLPLLSAGVYLVVLQGREVMQVAKVVEL